MTEEILSPLAGNVWKINVKEGDQIEEDDEIIILEAMKMETPIYAPSDGKIKSLSVKEGDSVEEDAVLAILE
ncbi:MAG: biotin/lipoyl-binding carrier protein [SAR324 cluster bacterium]|nr:biotin/lipoyl-binding carrier protein [SAR324 cluster bacterium]